MENTSRTHLTVPTVHLNGTSKESLLEGYETAYRALNECLDVVHKATVPNGRDYYTQGDSAFYKAADEHGARIQKLREVQDDLLALFEAVQEQK